MNSFFNFFSSYVKYKEYKAYRSDRYDYVEKKVDGFNVIDISSKESSKIDKRYFFIKDLSKLDLSEMNIDDFEKFFIVSLYNSKNKEILISNFDSYSDNNHLFIILLDDNGEIKLNINPYLIQFSNFGNKSVSKIINKFLK